MARWWGRLGYKIIFRCLLCFDMWGDVMNCVRWEEVNNNSSFLDGNVWKVKINGEVLEWVSFKTEMDAEKWLYNYYKSKNKWNLVWDKDDNEEGDRAK